MNGEVSIDNGVTVDKRVNCRSRCRQETIGFQFRINLADITVAGRIDNPADCRSCIAAGSEHYDQQCY